MNEAGYTICNINMGGNHNAVMVLVLKRAVLGGWGTLKFCGLDVNMSIKNQNKPLSVKLHEQYKSVRNNYEFENALSNSRIKSLRGWGKINLSQDGKGTCNNQNFSFGIYKSDFPKSQNIFSSICKLHAQRQ